MSECDGKKRVVIEHVKPEVDGGRFPIKRVTGEEVTVEADIFSDGHDAISAAVLYRKEVLGEWSEVPMEFTANDRWRASFQVDEIGRYRYTISAWIDPFATWRRDLARRIEAGQDVTVELLIGAEIVERCAELAAPSDAALLREYAAALRRTKPSNDGAIRTALSERLADLTAAYPDKETSVTYSRELPVTVDRSKARFSTWYEAFPRSCAAEPGRHGTFADCESRLPYIAAMGFDVLYLPPVHPIGRTHRKGKNNAPTAAPGDPGSPWAIGAAEGGHKAVHPQLGTLEDFRRLYNKAAEYGIEIALDMAFNCTPDHPYVGEHPEWFRWRPDKTVQYAENPPKKYQDIYPFDFENEHWRSLWQEIKGIVLFWIEQGVRIFRVDNPHTKPFRLWEWLIGEIKDEYPEVIFLAEAFTRPKVMYRLAKLGFTQSYTYFAWRNTKWELTQYFSELNHSEVHEFFRANLWPNTPDILTEYLQSGGRPAFMARLVLAATLGANYGIYGPAFELCEDRPREQGSEEYLDSEKYEIKRWDIASEDSLKSFIARVNRARRDNAALQSDLRLRFHKIHNEHIICYSKHTANMSNIVVVAVNLDPHHTHSGWIELPLNEMGIDARRPFQAHDIISGARYLWQGTRNYVELDPHICPAHIFVLKRHIHSERDFDYFM